MYRIRLFLAMSACGLLLCPRAAVAQTEATESSPAPSSSLSASASDEGFHWGAALAQSGFFLGVQTSLRMVQAKTRNHLGGSFWHDYVASVKSVHGWNDGNPVITNYGGHPMMGAVASFIQIQNDSEGKRLAWDPNNRRYWASRLKALGWAAGYSTAFELSPIGEAGIGNVGQDRGTAGYVDLVVTPLAGFGLMLLEDYLDARVIKNVERGKSGGTARFLRVLLNPDRAIANIWRLQRPSDRDTRPSPP